jgi:eukaryotic-like serine/threonine-protein kinase
MLTQIGPYEVLEELGRGAMGVVLRGFDPGIGRTVAIKLIRSQEFSTSEENIEARLRFTREASAAGRLSHPNIVTVYQLAEERGYQYLVMEFVPGASLERLMRDSPPLPIDQVLGILRSIADALDHAHQEGIVHRDIKPANILVRPDGKVKVTDFGIARVSSQTLTQSGFTFGTPAYMAPEQILAAKIDSRADQFSLAVLAYELFSGRKPFDADSSPALMMQILNQEPRAIDKVSPHIPLICSKVLARAMAKEPSSRYGSCSEFVQALASSLEYRPQSSRNPSGIRQVQPLFGVPTFAGLPRDPTEFGAMENASVPEEPSFLKLTPKNPVQLGRGLIASAAVRVKHFETPGMRVY